MSRRCRAFLFLTCLVLFASSAPTVSSAETTSTNLTETDDVKGVWVGIRASVRELTRNIPVSLTRKVLQADISLDCSLGLVKFGRAVENVRPWAYRLIDSTGKYPNGVFQGSLVDLGGYDECVETVIYDEYGNEDIRGQYCNMYVKMKNDTSLFDHIAPLINITNRRALHVAQLQAKDPGIRLGFCMVADCSQNDLQAIADELTEGEVEITDCATSHPVALTPTQRWIITAAGTIAGCMLLSTIVDWWTPSEKSGSPRRGIIKTLSTAFSVPANMSTLFEEDTCSLHGWNLTFLHGIRVISLFWIILLHTTHDYAFILTRFATRLEYADRIDSCIGLAGYLGYETLFFLSGFLLANGIYKTKQRNLFVAASICIHRFISITVPVFFVAVLFHLLPLVASGPSSPTLFAIYRNHLTKFWPALLLQYTNFQKELTGGVFGHLWYVSADFQLYVVSLIVLLLLKGKPRATITLFIILALGCSSYTAWQLNGVNYAPFNVQVPKTVQQGIDYMNNVYILPTTHAVCFFSGCITWLLVRQYNRKNTLKALKITLGWLLGISFGLACVFMRYTWNRWEEPSGDWAKILFAFSDKIMWSIFLSWIVFACTVGQGEPLRIFLSWEAFVPFSRLAFGAYLVHLPFLQMRSHISRERQFSSMFHMVTDAFAIFVWANLLSCVVFIACEAPTRNISNLVLKTKRREEPEKECQMTPMVPGRH